MYTLEYCRNMKLSIVYYSTLVTMHSEFGCPIYNRQLDACHPFHSTRTDVYMSNRLTIEVYSLSGIGSFCVLVEIKDAKNVNLLTFIYLFVP